MNGNGCIWCGCKGPEAHDSDCPNRSSDQTKQQTTLFDTKSLDVPVIGGRVPTTRKPKDVTANSRRGGRDGTGYVKDPAAKGGARRARPARGGRSDRGTGAGPRDPNLD